MTGGFSGATQVALDLCRAREDGLEQMLVLRRKRNTEPSRVEALRKQGLHVEIVPGWGHLATIRALLALCRQWKPDVLVAHGFPEHLIGRWAACRAEVPMLVQVEHSARERYTLWSRLQARWLMPRTQAFVGVSEGVRQSLLALGCPPERCQVIPNGVDLERFSQAIARPFADRQSQIVMSARFARQKDQLTLIRALAILRQGGMTPSLCLAGLGSALFRAKCQREVRRLGLESQVRFLGHHPDMPRLLGGARYFVLSTHWEGMPLALVEAMAAGCACIASDVVGVRGVLEPGRTGLLVPEGDASALAQALAGLLHDSTQAARLGAAAREQAFAEYGRDLMQQRYRQLLSQDSTQ